MLAGSTPIPVIVCVTKLVGRLMTETLSPRLFATYSLLPSGVMAVVPGQLPTGVTAATGGGLVRLLTALTVFWVRLPRYRWPPDRSRERPTGSGPTGIAARVI